MKDHQYQDEFNRLLYNSEQDYGEWLFTPIPVEEVLFPTGVEHDCDPSNFR